MSHAFGRLKNVLSGLSASISMLFRSPNIQTKIRQWLKNFSVSYIYKAPLDYHFSASEAEKWEKTEKQLRLTWRIRSMVEEV